ncbi:MAG: heavy-metal-associated protein [Bacteroidetes bacterium]|jgi:copper chaperone CopZ|nr:heavy-metal-associated protein [Bacteroidota bacterium]
MKKSIIIFLLIAFSQALSAQQKPAKEVKTAEFKVQGNCEQCRKRIENAAYIKGVKSTSWDETTKMLKVTYRTDKVTEMQIQEAVAKSGHQTEKVAVDKAAYAELPDCCKYQDKDCTNKK